MPLVDIFTNLSNHQPHWILCIRPFTLVLFVHLWDQNLFVCKVFLLPSRKHPPYPLSNLLLVGFGGNQVQTNPARKKNLHPSNRKDTRPSLKFRIFFSFRCTKKMSRIVLSRFESFVFFFIWLIFSACRNCGPQSGPILSPTPLSKTTPSMSGGCEIKSKRIPVLIYLCICALLFFSIIIVITVECVHNLDWPNDFPFLIIFTLHFVEFRWFFRFFLFVPSVKRKAKSTNVNLELTNEACYANQWAEIISTTTDQQKEHKLWQKCTTNTQTNEHERDCCCCCGKEIDRKNELTSRICIISNIIKKAKKNARKKPQKVAHENGRGKLRERGEGGCDSARSFSFARSQTDELFEQTK